MRTLMATAVVLTLPLISTPVYAQSNNDFMGQAQRFLNPNQGNGDAQERAYERGRRDQDNANRNQRDDQNARNQRGRYGDDRRYGRTERGYYDDRDRD
jgi:hypothetical protein